LPVGDFLPRAVATDLGFGNGFFAGAATDRRFAVNRINPRNWYAGLGS
jgi:hypothetical protein